MDVKTIHDLGALVSMLRDQGVTYFKSADLELHIAPKQSFPAAVAAVGDGYTPPEWANRLPPNYSHPSLLRMAGINGQK